MHLLDQLSARWRRDPLGVVVPVALLLVSLFVYTRALAWGLPTNDDTWAADAIKPSAPLAVLYHSFLSGGWNSGWFWFKYPPFHAFLLAVAYAPYMAWVWISGGISGFASEYPFGLSDPTTVLSNLALIGRSITAMMGVGTVLLAYACVVRSYGRLAATCAAFVTALSYPMVFYSQTTNVEVPFLFWMMLALLAAVRLIEGDERRRWWVLLGLGAALSVSTKELAAGAFVGLPAVLVAVFTIHRRPLATWLRGGLTAAAAFAVAMVLANNVLFNPLGFLHRVQFLTQTLPPEITARYAPYTFPVDLGSARDAGAELAQLSLAGRRVLQSLGWPTLIVSLAGIVLALRRRPAWAALLLAAIVTYYLVSVRAMMSLSLRYLLPVSVMAAMFAGIGIAALVQNGRGTQWRRPLAALALLFVAAYGWDVNRMMSGDGRYDAEAWLREQLDPHERVEVYQDPTYLPRFPQWARVDTVEFDQRNIEDFRKRQPDFVVLSSAGLSGVSVQYKQDWQESDGAIEGYTPAKKSTGGVVMSYSKDANTEFLAALDSGALGYEKVARFTVDPWIPPSLSADRAIQSLNPEITIYRRTASAFAGPGAHAAPAIQRAAAGLASAAAH
ncbi:MAG TPA: glycosyltransferase family 39 protein [Candidatus Limnocylindrales bacterium]|nr:glycosyltransferase family 39 protein [Candidatus Limnocylindrales bacterium]